jgi:hypothetical protein
VGSTVRTRMGRMQLQLVHRVGQGGWSDSPLKSMRTNKSLFLAPSRNHWLG